jgi:histidinol-phosphate aminotransferase
MQQNRAQIIATRRRLTVALRGLGFDVVDSQSNFVWSTHPSGEHRRIYEQLKAQKILVRYMAFPGADGRREGPEYVEGMRITVGTDAEIDRFLMVLQTLV